MKFEDIRPYTSLEIGDTLRLVHHSEWFRHYTFNNGVHNKRKNDDYTIMDIRYNPDNNTKMYILDETYNEGEDFYLIDDELKYFRYHRGIPLTVGNTNNCADLYSKIKRYTELFSNVITVKGTMEFENSVSSLSLIITPKDEVFNEMVIKLVDGVSTEDEFNSVMSYMYLIKGDTIDYNSTIDRLLPKFKLHTIVKEIELSSGIILNGTYVEGQFRDPTSQEEVKLSPIFLVDSKMTIRKIENSVDVS